MRALRKFYYEHELLFTKLYYFLTKPYHWYKWNFIQKPSCDRFIAKCDEDKRYSLIHDGEIYDLKLKYKDRYVEDFIRPLIDEHNPQLWFDYYFEGKKLSLSRLSIRYSRLKPHISSSKVGAPGNRTPH